MQNSYNYIKERLSPFYPESEIRSFWLLIMEKLTGLSRTQILTNKNSVLSAEQTKKLETIVQGLQKQEPIQYIFGETEFFSLPFFVNKNVLIPRQETEELVDWIIKDCNEATTILDIGTGSGCIAISLARNLPRAKVSALDISIEALKVAQQNANINKVHVKFIEADILTPTNHDVKYEVIVSNPPYVCESEKPEIQKNVLDYEPHLALFVSDSDPLLFYRKIADFALRNLISNGNLFFEINRTYGKETVGMLEDLGFKDIRLRKDLSGNDRMIKAKLK